MKFSVSQDYTLGFIDVLDYNKSIENWDFIDIFPINLAFAGKGSFYHPYYLNYADPLLDGLEICFREILEKDLYGENEEERMEKLGRNFLKFP